jgi:hypothetical protein
MVVAVHCLRCYPGFADSPSRRFSTPYQRKPVVALRRTQPIVLECQTTSPHRVARNCLPQTRTRQSLDILQHSIDCVQRQRKTSQLVSYALKTDGTRLNDAWCAFFNEHGAG